MRRIDDQIRVRWVMDGGDLAMPDSDGLMNHFDNRCQAVGCTRRSRHDMVFERINKDASRSNSENNS